MTAPNAPGLSRRIDATGIPLLVARLAVGGTAGYAIDYEPFLTNVFFSCGVTAIDLTISAYNELAVEGNESVTVALVPDPAYTILWPSNAPITIEDVGLNHAPDVYARASHPDGRVRHYLSAFMRAMRVRLTRQSGQGQVWQRRGAQNPRRAGKSAGRDMGKRQRRSDVAERLHERPYGEGAG